MAIITFHSNEPKETGQTLSLAAIATYMAIEHNYKILIMSTNFNDLTLENCFWEYSKIRPKGAVITDANKNNVGLESGIEGLLKVLASNRTSTEIVRNYSRIVLKDRLDVFLSPATEEFEEYEQIANSYTDVISIANRYYDLVFVDLYKKMPERNKQDILQMSDIVMLNITQRLRLIDDFMELRDNNEFYKRKNVMLNIGRYDKFSKYNNKNVTRYLKEKKPLGVVPYNTLFFEACSEGQIIEFLLKVRKIVDETDRNISFVKELQSVDTAILDRLQELQVKI